MSTCNLSQRHRAIKPESRATSKPFEQPCQLFAPTDVGNAQRFAAQHGKNVKYEWMGQDSGRWLVWDGCRYAPDEIGEVTRRAKETAVRIQHEVRFARSLKEIRAINKHAERSESRERIRAMLDLARSEACIAVRPPDLDRDPWLLNVKNGTLDLRTGELHPHRREQMITKLAPVTYDAEATCPGWDAFLSRIMGGDASLIAFIQRAIGYALAGLTAEQVVFILYGTGANGKSTLLEAVRFLLGDYATQASTSTFLVQESDRPRNDLARLRGVRLVSAVEVGEGQRLDEPLIKQATGGDIVTARFLYREFFEFTPAFKIFLAVNQKPTIRGADHGIWRRIRLLPFPITIPLEEQDRHLLDELKNEAPGILRWAMEGCLAYQRDGLGAPDTVTSATQTYREEMDALVPFLAERCVVDPGSSVPSVSLYKAYREWAEQNGERPVTQRKLGQRLAERGFILDQAGRCRFWAGIRLRAPSEEDGNRA